MLFKDGGPWLYLCSLQTVWGSVSDEDKAELETSCVDDPCDFACKHFQVRTDSTRKTSNCMRERGDTGGTLVVTTARWILWRS